MEVDPAGCREKGSCARGSWGDRSADNRLDVHAPVQGPHVGVDLPPMDIEELTQMLTEGGLEMRQVNEEVGLLDAHEASFLV